MRVGIGAMVAIVLLQSLLVIGTLTFQEEIGPVSVAFLVLVVWFVMTGHLGSASGALPHGRQMGLLAATDVGYPQRRSPQGSGSFPYLAEHVSHHLRESSDEDQSEFDFGLDLILDGLETQTGKVISYSSEFWRTARTPKRTSDWLARPSCRYRSRCSTSVRKFE